ncbi:MAG: VWA domain-containing protein [Chloroflexota bacterium]|nr:VWA domain-containing protein [Chloroflexota bacterium]
MSFGASGYLLLLVAAALAAGVAVYGAHWRTNARARFGTGSRRPRLALLTSLLLLFALGAASFAAARPQFGSRQTRADDRGIDLVIVLDVSQSMLAEDAQPTRLGRAQAEIGALLDRMHGDRVGLIIFAREPFVRSPLTSDLRVVQQLVAGIDHERGLVAPGSDLGSAILGGRRVLTNGDAQTKVMLIVSDGEDHGRGIAPALANARDAGILVYTAGAGTLAGAPVRDIDPATGQSTARLDPAGHPVLTRLDADALSRIAQIGTGRYIELSGDGRPLAGLAQEFGALQSTKFGGGTTSTPIERFQIFAALALVLVLAEMSLPVLLAGPAVRLPRAARLWPLAGAGLFAGAICAGGIAEVNRRGNEAYDRGHFAAAAGEYHTAQAIDPFRPEPYHNAGNAADQQGNYDSAIEETKRARDLAGKGGIEAQTEYDLGNHYAGAGSLRDAVEAYKRALLANPDDADAKHNLEVVQMRLNATPTATPRRQDDATPTPPPGNGSPQGTPGSGNGGGTPGATPAQGDQGTPTGSSDQELSPEQLQQRLNEALSGIDEDFTEEEARRILDLLDLANQQSTEQHQGTGGLSAPLDY